MSRAREQPGHGPGTGRAASPRLAWDRGLSPGRGGQGLGTAVVKGWLCQGGALFQLQSVESVQPGWGGGWSPLGFPVMRAAPPGAGGKETVC